jgi:PAS domain S-box-containing protein
MPEREQTRTPDGHSLVGSTLAEQPFFGVYLLQDGRFLYVNERFAEILGYSVEEVMALPSVLDTVYEDDREMVRANIRSRLDGEVEQIRYSLRGRKKDGSPVELEVSNPTCRSARGKNAPTTPGRRPKRSAPWPPASPTTSGTSSPPSSQRRG